MAISSYLCKAFGSELQTTIKEAIKILKPHLKEFDAIAVRGNSGVIVGSVVAYLLKKPLIVVRKPKGLEDSHASFHVESLIETGSYLIFDDQVAGGSTVRTIQKDIKLAWPKLKSNGYIYTYGCCKSSIGKYWELSLNYLVQ